MTAGRRATKESCTDLTSAIDAAKTESEGKGGRESVPAEVKLAKVVRKRETHLNPLAALAVKEPPFFRYSLQTGEREGQFVHFRRRRPGKGDELTR